MLSVAGVKLVGPGRCRGRWSTMRVNRLLLGSARKLSTGCMSGLIELLAARDQMEQQR